MQDELFEWDDTKAAGNWRLHRVTFEEATLAILDPFAMEWIDAREAYGEERVIVVGLSQGQLLTVVYTERRDRFRIISARKATRNEQGHYYRQNAP